MKIKLLIITSLIFFSCNDKVVEENIMTENQMIEFLFDVNLINSSRGFTNKSNYNYFAVRDTILFKKHKIDCLTFVRSNNFYTKNPKLYLKIYSGIGEKLKKLKDSLNNATN
mgnify:FL=1|tara:strand:- start:427 stop:762 length:336 start_codon:yes stop_codon:yes gene_type:complete